MPPADTLAILLTWGVVGVVVVLVMLRWLAGLRPYRHPDPSDPATDIEVDPDTAICAGCGALLWAWSDGGYRCDECDPCAECRGTGRRNVIGGRECKVCGGSGADPETDARLMKLEPPE